MPQLTQERLKEILHYDPSTGAFTWIKTSCNSIKNGTAAGSLQGKGYIVIYVDGKLRRAHRLAFLYMKGRLPIGQVDHSNHIRDDNRWDNLTDSTAKKNAQNKSLYCTNKSGHTGVTWHKRHCIWSASISPNGKATHLGCFDNIDFAIAARMEANIKYGFHPNHGK